MTRLRVHGLARSIIQVLPGASTEQLRRAYVVLGTQVSRLNDLCAFATLERPVVALWEVFYIENKRFQLDTLRVPNRSRTSIAKSNAFLGHSDDIWGARGPPFPADLEGSGGGRPKTHIFEPFETAFSLCLSRMFGCFVLEQELGRGRVRTAIFQRRSLILGRFRPGSGGKFNFLGT